MQALAPPRLTARNPWPPESISGIAAYWRAHPWLGEDITPTGQRTPQGERGGLWVMSVSFPGRSAYMKPTKLADLGPFGAVAAREKIAADLAHDLNVHVPPAILANRGRSSDWPDQVVLSLRLYGAQLEWSDVKFRMSGRLGRGGYLDIGALAVQVAPRDAARAFAFDWWLNQPDHGEFNSSNIAFAAHEDGAEPAFLFFDYEKSMGFGDGSWQDISVPPPFPADLLRRMDHAEVASTADQIASLPAETIREVVERIPDSFLSAGERPGLISNLTERRVALPAVVNRYLSEARSS